MKKIWSIKNILFVGALFFGIVTITKGQQAFRKGSLLLSVSEGNTWGNFSTSDVAHPDGIHANPVHLHGCRDPFIVEYGLSNRWGIGFTMGNDIFKFNPTSLYHTDAAGVMAKASTTEFTFDCSYHFFIRKRLDFSAFGAMGPSSVLVNSGTCDATSQYKASGFLIRTGIRARYYFLKRFGVFAMVSAYASGFSPQGVKGSTFGASYNTGISGIANEFGFCCRLCR